MFFKLQGTEEEISAALEENSELGKHLRKAWEMPGADQKEKDGFMVKKNILQKPNI